MSKNTFKKVKKSAKPLYGERALLVCGFSPEEQKTLAAFLEAENLGDLAVVYATEADSTQTLQDLFSRPDKAGSGAASGLSRAIIVAGITEGELHRLLSAYKNQGLPRPLWATLTPYSDTWPLADLITELQREREAMEGKKKNEIY